MIPTLVCIKVGSKGVEDEKVVKELVGKKAQYISSQKAFAEMQRLGVQLKIKRLYR
jgi:hypothetical protein